MSDKTTTNSTTTERRIDQWATLADEHPDTVTGIEEGLATSWALVAKGKVGSSLYNAAGAATLFAAAHSAVDEGLVSESALVDRLCLSAGATIDGGALIGGDLTRGTAKRYYRVGKRLPIVLGYLSEHGVDVKLPTASRGPAKDIPASVAKTLFAVVTDMADPIGDGESDPEKVDGNPKWRLQLDVWREANFCSLADWKRQCKDAGLMARAKGATGPSKAQLRQQVEDLQTQVATEAGSDVEGVGGEPDGQSDAAYLITAIHNPAQYLANLNAKGASLEGATTDNVWSEVSDQIDDLVAAIVAYVGNNSESKLPASLRGGKAGTAMRKVSR